MTMSDGAVQAACKAFSNTRSPSARDAMRDAIRAAIEAAIVYDALVDTGHAEFTPEQHRRITQELLKEGWPPPSLVPPKTLDEEEVHRLARQVDTDSKQANAEDALVLELLAKCTYPTGFVCHGTVTLRVDSTGVHYESWTPDRDFVSVGPAGPYFKQAAAAADMGLSRKCTCPAFEDTCPVHRGDDAA